MDSSSHTRPKKPLLVIGNMTSSGTTHPKPSGYSSNSELQRDSRNNYEDRRYNNLPLKKSRTLIDSKNGNKTVVMDNEASESQKVKDESAKHVAKLQRQKEQLESQLKESKCKIQDLEKTHKLKDDSEKLVAELISQLKQSTSKIKDLEKMQNVKDDESAKLVAELQRQKALLEIDSEKLKQSEAKNQDLENKLKNAEDEFFQERAHRDSTEHDLRNKLREAFATIRTLTSKVNSLEAEKTLIVRRR